MEPVLKLFLLFPPKLRSLIPAAPSGFLGHFLCICIGLKSEAVLGLGGAYLRSQNFSEFEGNGRAEGAGKGCGWVTGEGIFIRASEKGHNGYMPKNDT